MTSTRRSHNQNAGERRPGGPPPVVGLPGYEVRALAVRLIAAVIDDGRSLDDTLARELGAAIVIAVDVVYPPEDAFVYSATGVMFQAFAVSVHRLKEYEKAGADLVIAPVLRKTSGQFTFADRAHLIAAGEQAALQMLPAIRAAFASSPVVR